MRYAVNIYDWAEELDAKNPLCPESLLLRPILTRETVICNPKYPDEDSMLVKESVTDDRWKAIVQLLRGKFGHERNKRRLYESKTGRGGWKRV